MIRTAIKESIGDLIFYRTYLAIGDLEAARFHSERLSAQMADSLLKVFYNTNSFALPLEQVQIIGSTAPAIEELKQAVLQFGGGG